jgi:hypothetical protein
MSGTDADLLQKEDQKTNKKLRPLIKKFLLIMLNNKSGNGAIQALREAYIKGKIKAERRGETFVDPPFRIIKNVGSCCRLVSVVLLFILFFC